MISTTPKGHAPARKPYALERRQPQAKAKTKPRCRDSNAYMSIMKVRATIPNAVSMRRRKAARAGRRQQLDDPTGRRGGKADLTQLTWSSKLDQIDPS